MHADMRAKVSKKVKEKAKTEIEGKDLDMIEGYIHLTYVLTPNRVYTMAELRGSKEEPEIEQGNLHHELSVSLAAYNLACCTSYL
ncbi:hypothetical protein ANTPLA_LOCUS29 [Anthophora plagiata]